MFGKPVSDYLRFQRVALVTLASVGVLRLALSLGGVPTSSVKFLSMNVVGWAAVFYYGVAVYRSGFGSYKQLVPLATFQIALQQAIACLGILIAIAGFPNVFSAPEFSAGSNQWVHLAAHLTVGIVVPILLFWGIGSLTMLITKKVSRPAYA